MSIELQIKIKDEKTTHTEKDILQLPLEISKSNSELVQKVASVYQNFMDAQSVPGQDAPEITLKLKMIWQM